METLDFWSEFYICALFGEVCAMRHIGRASCVVSEYAPYEIDIPLGSTTAAENNHESLISILKVASQAFSIHESSACIAVLLRSMAQFH